MAISIDSNPTQLSACDTTTGWAGGDGQLLADTAVYVEGAGSLSDWVNNKLQATVTYTIGASTNMSNDGHLYCWMYCSGRVDTQANGGYRLVASDGTNTATWFVGGSDTHGTGWQLLVTSLSATPDIGTLPNASAITTVGIAFKTLTIAAKKGQTFINNCFWDNIQYGNGLTITSLATDQITMEDIYAIDNSNSNKWGVVQKSNGAYIINGNLIFGNTGTGSIDMVLDGEVVLYPDNSYVSSTFNTIQVLGNATGTSNFEVLGSFLKANNVTGTLDINGTNLDIVSVTGASFVNMGVCDFTSSQTVTGNVFDSCSAINPLTSTFTSNTIKNSGLITIPSGGLITTCDITNSTSASSVTAVELEGIDLCSFTSDGSNHAVELTSIGAGSMTWNNITTGYDTGVTGSPVTPTATGNEDLYINVASGTITINVAAGATTPSIRSAGAVVNVVAGLVTATFNVSPAITGYEYAIYTVTTSGSLAGAVEKQHVEVHNSSTFAYTYTYVPGVVIAVQLLFGDGSVNDYAENTSYYTLAASDQTVNINLLPDTNN